MVDAGATYVCGLCWGTWMLFCILFRKIFFEEAITFGGTRIGIFPFSSRIALTFVRNTSGFSIPSLRAADE